MSKTVPFQTVQFSINTQFKCKKTVNSNHGLVLFNPLIGPYQVLPLRTRVDLEVMAMKGCSAFPKAPASLEPHHQIV